MAADVADRWARLQPWALPGFLALVVGIFLLLTPTWGYSLGPALWPGVPWLSGDLLLGPGLVLPVLNACVVGGVLVSRRSVTWGTVLTALPFATLVVTGAFVWGWTTGVYLTTVPSAAILGRTLWSARRPHGRRGVVVFTGLRSTGLRRATLREALALGSSGSLRAVVDQEYPLDRIADAHRHVEHEHKAGTVVVTLG